MTETIRCHVGETTWYIDVHVADRGSPGGLDSPGDPPEIRILGASADHPTEPGWIHRSAEDFGPRWLERAEQAIIDQGLDGV